MAKPASSLQSDVEEFERYRLLLVVQQQPVALEFLDVALQEKQAAGIEIVQVIVEQQRRQLVVEPAFGVVPLFQDSHHLHGGFRL